MVFPYISIEISIGIHPSSHPAIRLADFFRSCDAFNLNAHGCCAGRRFLVVWKGFYRWWEQLGDIFGEQFLVSAMRLEFDTYMILYDYIGWWYRIISVYISIHILTIVRLDG